MKLAEAGSLEQLALRTAGDPRMSVEHYSHQAGARAVMAPDEDRLSSAHVPSSLLRRGYRAINEIRTAPAYGFTSARPGSRHHRRLRRARARSGRRTGCAAT